MTTVWNSHVLGLGLTVSSDIMTPARDPKHAIFWLFGWVFGRGTDPKGPRMAVVFIWVDSWVLATILDPFQVKSSPSSTVGAVEAVK